jgi:phosphoserine phosphatase
MNVTGYLGETLPKLKEGKIGIRLILLPDNHLKTNQFQALIKSLQSVNLNCCFHNAQAKFLPIIQSLKIDLIQLPNSQHYFLDNCYQRIKFNAQFSSLYTGLVIADTRIIQSALVEILGSSINPHSLILQTGTMTVIHYPVSTHRPLIQAINFTAIK